MVHVLTEHGLIIVRTLPLLLRLGQDVKLPLPLLECLCYHLKLQMVISILSLHFI